MAIRQEALMLATIALAGLATIPATAARPDGQLELRVVDSKTGLPVAARVHLRDSRRRAVKTRGIGPAQHGDHFYLDGALTLGLRRGQYTFDLDAGWESRTRAGHFEIQRRAEDSQTVEINRFADLAAEGWFAADIDAERPLKDLPLVLRAEHLAYAPLTAWRAQGKGWQTTVKQIGKDAPPTNVGLHVARVDSPDGALLFCRSGDPIQKETLPPPGDLSLAALREARDDGYLIIAPDITAWRLPVWLAADVLDGLAVIDRTNAFQGVDDKKPTGRPRDKKFFPGARGVGRWREAIYFHAIDAGLRMPAVAGSGSGDSDSPLGTNRVYASCPAGFTTADWWDAVAAGETVVTCGPLLRPSVLGQAPGYVFRLDSQGQFEAAIALNLSTRQPIEYLELIQNGELAASVRLADWASAGGKLPVLKFDNSGWFAVRAVTTANDRYQYALTSPYYVESPSSPRISTRSCQFFLTWLEEHAKQLGAGSEAWQSEEIEGARQFWKNRLSQATAP